MKSRTTTLGLLFSLVLGASCLAWSPAQMAPEECVQKSDYIFVGEKMSTHYVDTYGRVLTPKQAQKILAHVQMEVRLKVVTVLYPSGFKPTGIAKLRMGHPGGPVETVQSLKEMLPLSLGIPKGRIICLTRVVSPAGREAYVVPPAPGNATPWLPLAWKRQVLTWMKQKPMSSKR